MNIFKQSKDYQGLDRFRKHLNKNHSKDDLNLSLNIEKKSLMNFNDTSHNSDVISNNTINFFFLKTLMKMK